MLNKLLILIFVLILISCSEDEEVREYGNNLGGIGRNSSFEFVDNFEYQLFNQVDIDATTGALSSPLLLKDEQYILTTDNGKIISVFKNKKDWEFELDSGSIIGTNVSADKQDNIYAIDDKGIVYSLNSKGKLRFKKQIIKSKPLEIFNVPLVVNNKIVYTSSGGNIVITDSVGNEIYSNSFNSSIIDFVSAINNDNILITLSNNQFGKTDTLVSLNSQGIENWRYSVSGYRFVKGAISNGKNIAIAGTKKGGENPLSKIFYLDKKGKQIWSKEISTIPRFLSMAKNGFTYLVSYSSGMGQMLSGVFAYNQTGDLEWKIYYDYSIPMPLYITKDELFFLASNRETYGLFYLQRKDGKLIKSLDIGDTNPIVFIPEIGDDGTIIFAGKQNLRLIRIDESAINKILPY